MRIKFYHPFNEKIGRDLMDFRVDGEITVNEFSRRLVEKFPFFRDYVTGGETYPILNSIFFVARKGTLLRPEDKIKDEDELEIIAPMTGG